jgi:Reverse transcriptase (RNA-dependent DNA polymerase)
VIDRILQTTDGTQSLVTDPKEIKRLTNDHFQTCPGGIHVRKEIPSQWNDQYLPKQNIDASIYSTLMNPPTESEWFSVINKLPNDKAAGPSGITNEMLKHLGPMMAKCLWKFICACILLNDIPQAWREAHVYPIPKPKEWECNLNNTRPITLLETTRKAMVRVLNNRLAEIMVQHKILKGNQFAGLPNMSTFEPLRIINEIVQDAKEQNKEFWLLSQDLSKAYDRVNIYMLKKAFQRLKIPTFYIDIICSLFTHRQN